MNCLATLLIVATDPVAAAPLLERLDAAGYAVVVASESPLAQARRLCPDLILIGEAAGDPVAFAIALRADPACADVPLVLLVDRIDGELAHRAFEAGIDEMLSIGAEDPELLTRLRPLVRLATMHDELRVRAAAAASFGLKAAERVTPPSGPERPALLLIGPDPDGIATRIDPAEAEATTSPDLYAAERLLERTPYDAAILTASGEAELAFASELRHNTRLFNLPVVMLSDSAEAVPRAYRRGASRVLVRPVEDRLLHAAVRTLVRRQRLRWAIRATLGQSLGPATRDPLTGAYSRPFLDRALDLRLAAARERDRPLTVVLFAIPSVDSVRAHFGEEAGDHLIRQIGQWINRLVRAEDLTARFSANRFCVVLPDTPLVEAEVVMHRIAGVLSHTDFAIPDVFQPVRVWVQVACAEVCADDDRPILLGRATQALEDGVI